MTAVTVSAPGAGTDADEWGDRALAARLRRAWWRAVFASTGGITVRGTLPAGPCVVVANHASHADAPALLAALPASSRPAVAAAADYWFRSALRARLCRRLVAGFPVRRNGGGSADLAAAAALLQAGRAVVVFPEGTRSRTGRVGDFRTGALRLAAAAGVPVVPVAILGTRRLLPVHGRPGRGHVEVRVGAPVAGADAEAAREAVTSLLAEPAAASDSRARARVAAFAASPAALVAVALWAFAEALSWPIVPEVPLGVLLLARPPARRAVALTLTAAAGGVAGCLLGYALAAGGHAAPGPLTTPRVHAVAAAQTRALGPAAVRHQPWSGIPVKVYAAEAGRQHVAVPAFAAETARARGLRLATVALLVSAAALLVPRRHYAAVVLLSLTGFAVGLAKVLAGWS